MKILVLIIALLKTMLISCNGQEEICEDNEYYREYIVFNHVKTTIK